jgi:hypothetical protein
MQRHKETTTALGQTWSGCNATVEGWVEAEIIVLIQTGVGEFAPVLAKNFGKNLRKSLVATETVAGSASGLARGM